MLPAENYVATLDCMCRQEFLPISVDGRMSLCSRTGKFYMVYLCAVVCLVMYVTISSRLGSNWTMKLLSFNKSQVVVEDYIYWSPSALRSVPTG